MTDGKDQKLNQQQIFKKVAERGNPSELKNHKTGFARFKKATSTAG